MFSSAPVGCQSQPLSVMMIECTGNYQDDYEIEWISFKKAICIIDNPTVI